MNETQRKLLARGLVVLPETIEHETYEYVLEALVEMTGQQVYMYCKGDGGDSRSALAIADLIALHGDVVGLLVGEANSSHVTVWASCQTRYVSPHGGIGVHKVAWSSFDGRVDSHNMRLVADQFDATEAKTARILEGASDYGWDWWLKLIQQVGSSGLRQFDAAALIRMEMARPIAEFDDPSSGDSPRGENSQPDYRRARGVLADERVISPEQIEWLKGLGYVVIDLNDNEFGAEVVGPNWQYSMTNKANKRPGHKGTRKTEMNAWFAAYQHAVHHSLFIRTSQSEGGEKPVISEAQIETLKGLGYRVHKEAEPIINGVSSPTGWSITREWKDPDRGQQQWMRFAGSCEDGWALAWGDAVAEGLVDPADGDSPKRQDPSSIQLVMTYTEDSPQGESDLDARLKRHGAQF